MTSTTQIETAMPIWQDIEKAIKNIVDMALYYKKPKNGKFLQSYKKCYSDLHGAEEPNEYIVKFAINLYPNKEKYMQMKEEYKNWYRFKPLFLKAVEKLNIIYYKLAKDHFSIRENLRKETDDFFNNNDNTDDMDADEFLKN